MEARNALAKRDPRLRPLVRGGAILTRVAFPLAHLSAQWLGGVNYFRNLLAALMTLPERRVDPVLLLGRTTDMTLLDRFPRVETIRSGMLDARTAPWVLRMAWKRAMGHDRALESLLVRRRIDLVSHSELSELGARIPAIGWIPDFQHRHLPELFSPGELQARDLGIAKKIEQSSMLLVSSHSAQRDLEAIAPRTPSRVLQFVVDPGTRGEIPISSLESSHGFRGPYFHLPNQFWAHKNHQVVIEALSILKDRGQTLQVVATGSTHDFRQPGHFEKLIANAEQRGVRDRFIVAGITPYDSLISLMRNSIAVLNPSFFEGWSTTVEEAKSLGKRLVLSDLPVHREQAPGNAIFFDPRQPVTLADAMWSMFASQDPREERARQSAAEEELPARKRAFARAYEEVVIETLSRA